MKKDIILSGVGGQGILSIAAVIGTAAIASGRFMKQSEVHGMSQRGGAVQSHLRISDQPVFSDLIPRGSCDMILSVEPMESLRYLDFLAPGGWLVTNTRPFRNIEDYPGEEELYTAIGAVSNHLMIDADAIAADTGSRKVSNIVMVGAASGYLDIAFEALEESIRTIFGRKGDEVVEMNLGALSAGKKAASAYLEKR